MFFFFQAEDGIRDFCLSRGLGDVYKRQMEHTENPPYWFWHQGIVNNNIDSSVNMEAVSRTLSRLVLIKDNKSSN